MQKNDDASKLTTHMGKLRIHINEANIEGMS